ncbi:MAG: AsmA family protein [Halioglobus sp.]
MLRPIVIVIAIPVVLLVLAVILLPLLIDRDQLLAIATHAVEEQTGATLNVKGEAKLSIFPTLGVSLGEVSLELSGEIPQTLQARALQIGVQLLPLISREIEIDALSIDGMQANVQLPVTAEAEQEVRTAELSDEQLDEFYARRRTARTDASPAEAGAAIFAAPLTLNIGKLSITDSQLTLNDPVSGEVTEVNIEALTATNINTEGLPMTIALRLQLPKAIDEETLAVTLESELRVDLPSQQVTLEALEISVAGATQEPLSLQASGVVELADLVADLELRVSSGDIEGQGQLRYASLGSPQIDANMAFNVLNPALLALAGPEAATAGPSAAAPGSDDLPLDLLRNIDTRLNLQIELAVMGEYSAKNLQLQLRAVDGVLDVSELKGETLKGSFDLIGNFNAKYNNTTLSTTGSIDSVDLVQMLKLAGVDADAQGSATVGWEVSAAGATVSALINSVAGSISAKLDEGYYQGRALKLATDGTIDLSRELADLNLNFGLDQMTGSGKVRYAAKESPQIDATLTMNLLDPALLALAGPEAAAEAQNGTQSTSDTGDEPLQLQALRAIDTQVEIKIDRAIYQTHTIENLHVQARGVDGVIKINSLTGTLHGGELRMGATLNVTEDITKIASRGSIKGLDIATMLVALESDPVMSGVASVNWQINSRGTTSNELYGSLRGPAKLNTENTVLKDIGIEKMLCQTVAVVNQQKLAAEFPSDTAFKDLSMDIQLGNGLARLKPLRADLEDVTLRGQGELNLLTDKFEAEFAARLSVGLAELDPACAINQRYTAIAWPVSCEGDITGDPADWCGVDSGKIIEELATNEVKRKVQKEAGKLLEGLFNR